MFYALYYILNTDTHCMTKTQDNSEIMKHSNDGKMCSVSPFINHVLST